MKSADESPRHKFTHPHAACGLVLAIVFLASAHPAHASRTTLRKRGEVRVVVTYKQEYSSTDRQSLHLTLKMGFMKHFKATHSDLVHVIWSRALSKSEAKARAQAICGRYLESPLVKSCVPAL